MLGDLLGMDTVFFDSPEQRQDCLEAKLLAGGLRAFVGGDQVDVQEIHNLMAKASDSG